MWRAAWTAVFSLLIAGAARPTVSRRVLFIGDSLTANLHLLGYQNLPERVGRTLGPYVIAQSIAAPGATMSGYGIFPGFGSQTSLIDVVGGFFVPQALVILLGTNDYDTGSGAGIPLDAFRAAYSAFLASVPPGISVICITPPWMSNEPAPNSVGHTLEDYRMVIRQVCAGRMLIEGSEAVPHDPAYYLDSVHPNNRGTVMLARAIVATLRPLLGQ